MDVTQMKEKVKSRKTNQMHMLSGSILKKLLIYAIPIAASSIIQQLFNATDVAVVGKFAGSDALAAVGSNTPVTALFINIFVGLSVGANVVIANYIGQQRENEINDVLSNGDIVYIGKICAYQWCCSIAAWAGYCKATA